MCTGRLEMLDKLTASEARQNFSNILSRAEYRGERVIVHRGKKAVAAVVPIEDVELLERLEDEIDVAAARKALKDPRTIPWEKIKKDLKL
ncbi:MAG TPA: type II toxin-antitoxin system Phd/YefM family antitoxin, partial [Candidatus Aquilonibacter sp.]|jgi:prevent-host-death family protein|nr:type II toxin-antitoxin system Phd/YefM family antitoxin [Candidatus Aquilonibacter sp.]